MKERILAALAKVEPRVLLGTMICALCLLGLEGWILLLGKPLAQYRQVAATRVTLASAPDASGNRRFELDQLAADLKVLTERLTGELRLPGSDDQMTASLMSELDRSAARSGVMLTGVKPDARRQVQAFEEIAFDINAQGKYLMLCEWLMDFENALGRNVTVTEFVMKSADEGRQVALSLKVALYRPFPAGTGK